MVSLPPAKLLECGRAWIEVWNSDADARRAVESLVDPAAVIHGADIDAAALHGPEDYLHYLEHMRAAFPDMQIRVLSMEATVGSSVVCRCG
jgi:predicted ester cyclase